MKHLLTCKLFFILFAMSWLLTSCQFIRYIKASDYDFNEHITEPKIGMPAKDMWKKKNIWIYEGSKKKAKPITRSVQEYRTDSSTFYISLFYKKMVIADDITSDNEIFPVIINMDAKIILTGWKSYDSLRLIRYTDRMKQNR